MSKASRERKAAKHGQAPEEAVQEEGAAEEAVDPVAEDQEVATDQVADGAESPE